MTDPRSTHPAPPSPSTASAQVPADVPGHAEPSTASHWAEWQRRHGANPTLWTEWSDHPTLLAALQQLHFGDAATSPMAYLLQRYPQFTQAHALSLCCGDGSTEKALVRHGVFRSMVGVDLTAERVRAAEADLGDLADRLRFEVGDVNLGDYGQACYDVVFAKASLHHVERLEAMAAGVQRCLRPGGRLVTLDFFGPTRFQ